MTMEREKICKKCEEEKCNYDLSWVERWLIELEEYNPLRKKTKY